MDVSNLKDGRVHFRNSGVKDNILTGNFRSRELYPLTGPRSFLKKASKTIKKQSDKLYEQREYTRILIIV